jgi:competence protein ComEA
MRKGFSIAAVQVALARSGAGFALFLALIIPAHSQTSKESSLPEGDGKELVETVCDQCHGLKDVTDLRKTSQEWRDIVQDMVARDAPLLDDEVDVVVAYLAKNFGPDKTSAPAPAQAASDKVNVNKASVKELETALALSGKEAEAVVQYRQKNGNFGKWEDLKKVPGLDAAKIEEKKDRLSF